MRTAFLSSSLIFFVGFVDMEFTKADVDSVLFLGSVLVTAKFRD